MLQMQILVKAVDLSTDLVHIVIFKVVEKITMTGRHVLISNLIVNSSFNFR